MALGSIIGAAIGGISSLIGGKMSSDLNRENNAAIIADKEKDRQLQREFAQSGVTWRAEDAKRAGIHPIYALGSAGASYTPSSISLGADPMGSMVASAGQNFGSAISRTSSQGQRTDAFTKVAQALTLEKGALENELLRSQIARGNATQSPPMPVGDRFLIPGQTGSTLQSNSLVQTSPMERTASEPGRGFMEPGAINDVGFVRTANGGYMPVPSKDVKDRIEDNFFHEAGHFMRNNIIPFFSKNNLNPPFAPPRGREWFFDPMDGYMLRDTKFQQRFHYGSNSGRR